MIWGHNFLQLCIINRGRRIFYRRPQSTCLDWGGTGPRPAPVQAYPQSSPQSCMVHPSRAEAKKVFLGNLNFPAKSLNSKNVNRSVISRYSKVPHTVKLEIQHFVQDHDFSSSLDDKMTSSQQRQTAPEHEKKSGFFHTLDNWHREFDYVTACYLLEPWERRIVKGERQYFYNFLLISASKN
jgi:hypothetical protein